MGILNDPSGNFKPMHIGDTKDARFESKYLDVPGKGRFIYTLDKQTGQEVADLIPLETELKEDRVTKEKSVPEYKVENKRGFLKHRKKDDIDIEDIDFKDPVQLAKFIERVNAKEGIK